MQRRSTDESRLTDFRSLTQSIDRGSASVKDFGQAPYRIWLVAGTTSSQSTKTIDCRALERQWRHEQ